MIRVNQTLREALLWALSGISLSGLVAVGVAYGEQKVTVQNLVKDVDSLSSLTIQAARDNERLNSVVTQQTRLIQGQTEQRALLQQILLNVRSMSK